MRNLGHLLISGQMWADSILVKVAFFLTSWGDFFMYFFQVAMYFDGNTAVVGAVGFVDSLDTCSWVQASEPFFDRKRVLNWNFVHVGWVQPCVYMINIFSAMKRYFHVHKHLLSDPFFISTYPHFETDFCALFLFSNILCFTTALNVYSNMGVTIIFASSKEKQKEYYSVACHRL